MLEYVNAKVGSFNDRRFSNGNIYPVTACPFGMANFVIQTDGERGNWFYSPLSHTFEGIRLTHQPSPWVGDYGHLLMLPYSGELMREPGNRWSSFRPEKTVINPEHIGVYLQRYRLQVNLAPTERGAIISVKNDAPQFGAMGLALLPFADSRFSVSGNAITGYTDSQSFWGFKRIREYFYIVSSSPIEKFEQIENCGLAVTFKDSETEIAVATSFVSEEQAKHNYELELSGKKYADAERAARASWEDYLGRIEVSDENPERKRMFYSCLYRALLYPRVFHEYKPDGMPVHYNADTDKVEKGVFYTDNGFWDTFRTEYPLLTLIAPDRLAEMLEGFINYSEETGWLPRWLSPGELGIMPGTLIEAVLADAAVKGILKGDLRKRAYAAMKKNAYTKGEGRHGRQGCIEYIKYGYVPDDFRESVNHTCDCAYGDFCISRVAELEKDDKTAKELLARSKSYVNIFDSDSKFLRGKDRNGKFAPAFDPYSWGGNNCEGSSWQNSFAVYHDIEGLAELYGGKEILEARLDELFGAAPEYRVGGYAQEIHEMSEMACVDFGQCAISNQPSFHIPWLYSVIGKRNKTEYWVEKLANEAFFCRDDGFPGDEDNGTMACWYIFACLGFYPLCPGKAEYVSSKPLFKDIKIRNRSVKRFEKNIVSHEEIFDNK